jgi:hypothetical protein
MAKAAAASLKPCAIPFSEVEQIQTILFYASARVLAWDFLHCHIELQRGALEQPVAVQLGPTHQLLLLVTGFWLFG